jgi:uncharacterized protein
MNTALRATLINIAKNRISPSDVSHDFEHAIRVLANAEHIAKIEKADLDVIIPAALFHDLVVYPKGSPNSYKSQEDSATQAAEILINQKFSADKIEKIKTCILECSFSKGIIPTLLESKIIQDADLLEASGAIAIMRTFSSCGQMQRPFYNANDPFCKNRQLNDVCFGVDHFYNRLLIVGKKMHTKTARAMVKRRKRFLEDFLKELGLELAGK